VAVLPSAICENAVQSQNHGKRFMNPTPAPLPDRLSIDPQSKHYVAAVFENDIGIRFNGKERHDVEEYCISERWIKVASGKTRDRKGKPLMITLKGTVEVYYRDARPEAVKG
jgi:Protein of unknown function (DUF3297)